MKIRYKEIQNLPPLAWLANVKDGNVEIIHGENVKTYENFFVEGAWNGSFRLGDFLGSDWFCGTGGVLQKDLIVFSTPSHVTSGLFVSDRSSNSGGVLISNSLHFLCAYANYHIDPQYAGYETDFNSILDGIDDYKQSVYILDNNSNRTDVKVYYFRNIIVTDKNEITVTQKDKIKPFSDFSDYYNRLCMAISGMMENAKDKLRKIKYDPVTTISKGYDAPCCATIAYKYGCDTAVTFEATGKYAEDSGTEIAKKLGYKTIIERDADAYLDRTDLSEAQQICSGELGTDMCFITFDEDFHNKLVFTGDRGDSIWSRENPICNDSFRFSDMLSHLGNVERKLWVGYISVPMPLYGGSSWSSIQKISQSNEMQPWSLFNDYDRPIPRRIIEEAGIPRNSFGIKKHGAGIVLRYDWGGRAKTRMSVSASNDFDVYLKRYRKLHLLQLFGYLWKVKKIYLNRIGIKIKDKTSLEEKSRIKNTTSVRYLFPWASEVVQDQYKYMINQ